MWRKRGYELYPIFGPKCEYCRATFDVHHFGLLHFALDRDKPDDKNAYAFDVYMECPKCGLEEVFGVAVEREYYEGMLDTCMKSGTSQVIA